MKTGAGTKQKAVARKWRDLARRRLKHLLEMQRSGRWQSLFKDEAALLEQIEDAKRQIASWDRVHDGAGKRQAS